MTPVNFLPVEFLILQGVSKLMKSERRRTTSLSSKKRGVFRGNDFEIAAFRQMFQLPLRIYVVGCKPPVINRAAEKMPR